MFCQNDCTCSSPQSIRKLLESLKNFQERRNKEICEARPACCLFNWLEKEGQNRDGFLLFITELLPKRQKLGLFLWKDVWWYASSLQLQYRKLFWASVNWSEKWFDGLVRSVRTTWTRTTCFHSLASHRVVQKSDVVTEVLYFRDLMVRSRSQTGLGLDSWASADKYLICSPCQWVWQLWCIPSEKLGERHLVFLSFLGSIHATINY